MGLIDRLSGWVKKNILREKEEEEREEEKPEYVQTYKREEEIVEPIKQELKKPEKVGREKLEIPEEEELLQRRVTEIRRKPKMADIERHIGMSSVNSKEIPLSGNLADYLPIYARLISDNAKIDDKDVVNILLQNREKLKHRLSTEVRIYSEKGLAGTLVLTGVLIEDAVHVVNVNMSEGDYVEYLKEKLVDMYAMGKRQYQALNDEDGAIHIIEPYKITITKIEVETSFA